MVGMWGWMACWWVVRKAVRTVVRLAGVRDARWVVDWVVLTVGRWGYEWVSWWVVGKAVGTAGLLAGGVRETG